MSEQAEQAAPVTTASNDILTATVSIVSAFLSNNAVEASEVPGLIGSVHAALASTVAGAAQPEAPVSVPAIDIRKSITKEHIVCLEDGKKFRSMKRHLMSKFGMTPDEYRVKWGLPTNYPMVAPNYALVRSGLAKKNGLGQAHAA